MPKESLEQRALALVSATTVHRISTDLHFNNRKMVGPLLYARLLVLRMICPEVARCCWPRVGSLVVT